MLRRSLRLTLWLAAALAVAGYIVLSVRVLYDPAPRGAVEAAILSQARRIAFGQTPYPEATAGSGVPLMPAFPALVAPFVAALHAEPWQPRLVGFLATLVLAIVSGFVVLRETKSATLGITSAGMLLMSQGLEWSTPAGGGPVSLLLLLVLLGGLVLHTRARSARRSPGHLRGVTHPPVSGCDRRSSTWRSSTNGATSPRSCSPRRCAASGDVGGARPGFNPGGPARHLQFQLLGMLWFVGGDPGRARCPPSPLCSCASPPTPARHRGDPGSDRHRGAARWLAHPERGAARVRCTSPGRRRSRSPARCLRSASPATRRRGLAAARGGAGGRAHRARAPAGDAAAFTSPIMNPPV